MCAKIAAVNFSIIVRMQIIAAVSVLLCQGRRRCDMDNGFSSRIKEYSTSLSVIKEMLSSELIADKDYGIICLNLAEEYSISLCSIFAGIDLISAQTDGNI